MAGEGPCSGLLGPSLSGALTSTPEPQARMARPFLGGLLGQSLSPMSPAGLLISPVGQRRVSWEKGQRPACQRNKQMRFKHETPLVTF